MDEADRLCDRVAIINQGRIVAIDTPANLKARVGEDVVYITSNDAGRIADEIKAPWIIGAEQYDGQVIIRLHSAEDHLLELLGLISGDGYTITSISIRKPTLEDVFLHYTGREMRQEEAGAVDRMRMTMPRRN